MLTIDTPLVTIDYGSELPAKSWSVQYEDQIDLEGRRRVLRENCCFHDRKLWIVASRVRAYMDFIH